MPDTTGPSFFLTLLGAPKGLGPKPASRFGSGGTKTSQTPSQGLELLGVTFPDLIGAMALSPLHPQPTPQTQPSTVATATSGSVTHATAPLTNATGAGGAAVEATEQSVAPDRAGTTGMVQDPFAPVALNAQANLPAETQPPEQSHEGVDLAPAQPGAITESEPAPVRPQSLAASAPGAAANGAVQTGSEQVSASNQVVLAQNAAPNPDATPNGIMDQPPSVSEIRDQAILDRSKRTNHGASAQGDSQDLKGGPEHIRPRLLREGEAVSATGQASVANGDGVAEFLDGPTGLLRRSQIQEARESGTPASKTVEHGQFFELLVEGTASPGKEPIQPHAPRSVAGQITDAIMARAEVTVRDGRSEFRIHVEPPELGPVRVILSTSHQSLVARLVVQNETARQIVESHIESLRQSLSDAGVSLARLDVRQDGGHSGNNPHQEPLPTPQLAMSPLYSNDELPQRNTWRILSSDRVDVLA